MRRRTLTPIQMVRAVQYWYRLHGITPGIGRAGNAGIRQHFYEMSGISPDVQSRLYRIGDLNDALMALCLRYDRYARNGRIGAHALAQPLRLGVQPLLDRLKPPACSGNIF